MWDQIQQKIYELPALMQQRAIWKTDQQRVVFTNGCFDLLHLGHLHYLAEARTLGDQLIVGLNDTDSVRRLKGNHRPIQDEATRASMLAALTMVSAVVLFAEDTPLHLVQALQPDILVKGGDYTIANIVGAKEVLASGGEVKVLSFLPGYSTSSIEEKIIKATHS